MDTPPWHSSKVQQSSSSMTLGNRAEHRRTVRVQQRRGKHSRAAGGSREEQRVGQERQQCSQDLAGG